MYAKLRTQLGPGTAAPRPPRQNFIKRLVADGGAKVVMLAKPVLHVQYTRFVPILHAVKGLQLDDAFCQLKWSRKLLARRVEGVVAEFGLVAKEMGFDLSQTYIGKQQQHLLLLLVVVVVAIFTMVATSIRPTHRLLTY